MSEPGAPFLFTPSFQAAKYSGSTFAKILASSLSRSFFSGSIHVFRNQEMPLFKVERRHVVEVFVPTVRPEKPMDDVWSDSRYFCFGLGKHVKAEPMQWVIFMDAAGLGLRNIDHLIPPERPGPHGPQEIDMYWTKVLNENGERGEFSASPGLWAVRGEYLPMVLEKWKSAWSEVGEGAMLDEAAVWTRVLRDLPLRKKPFEKGEVIAPQIGSVDWEAVGHAAFVTVSAWPKKEQGKFLQAMYFGTYFGDETGMMLNILDA